MSKSLPPLNWFRAFESAARHLSFTAAGQEIGMTQSAISQQIKSLEMRLGVMLFHRKARGLALTDDGRRLVPQVDAALATLTKATDGFLPDTRQKVLTVAASVSVIQWVIAPNLASFQAAHPGVAIRFTSTVWPDEFTRTLADVEVRFSSQKQAGSGAEQLGSKQLVPVKSASLVGGVTDLPLIETVGTSDGWKSWQTAASVTLAPAAIRVDSYGVALQIAQHGSGICLVSDLLAAPAIATGAFARADALSIPANEGYFMTITKDAPLAQDFGAWLRALARPSGSIKDE